MCVREKQQLRVTQATSTFGHALWHAKVAGRELCVFGNSDMESGFA